MHNYDSSNQAVYTLANKSICVVFFTKPILPVETLFHFVWSLLQVLIEAHKCDANLKGNVKCLIKLQKWEGDYSTIFHLPASGKDGEGETH